MNKSDIWSHPYTIKQFINSVPDITVNFQNLKNYFNNGNETPSHESVSTVEEETNPISQVKLTDNGDVIFEINAYDGTSKILIKDNLMCNFDSQATSSIRDIVGNISDYKLQSNLADFFIKNNVTININNNEQFILGLFKLDKNAIDIGDFSNDLKSRFNGFRDDYLKFTKVEAANRKREQRLAERNAKKEAQIVPEPKHSK
jgi:hypothetical protein